MNLHTLSLIAVLTMFCLSVALICKAIDRQPLRNSDIARPVTLIHIDTDAEIEKQQGWQ